MKKAEVSLLMATLIWGSTFPLMKISLANLSPMTLLALRLGVALFPITILILLLKGKFFSLRESTRGLALAMSLFAGHALQIYGLRFTSATNSAFLTSMYIIFVPILSYKILKERLKVENVLSLAIAVLGLYLLTGYGELNVGDIFTLLCAIAFSFQIVLVQKYSKENYLLLTFWQTFWSFLFSAIAAVSMEKFERMNIGDILVVLYLGLCGSFLGFIIQMKYQKEVRTSRAALIYSIEPVFGAILSFILLSEVLALVNYIGALLIVLAVWIDTKTLKN